MEKYDVIVVGGGPAGMIAAVTAKKCDGGRKVLLIREFKTSLIPCGIPYIFSTLSGVEKDVAGDKPLQSNGVEIKIDRVSAVDPKAKSIRTAAGDSFGYEKLVLATGSSAVKLPIHGIDLPGVFLIKKDFDYLKKLRQEVHGSRNIVIVGGGFIGVEFADDISGLPEKSVTVVEMLPHLVGQAFDDEFAVQIEEQLRQARVNILTGKKVARFAGRDKVEEVVLSSGERIPADVVIVSIGVRANSELAEQAGLNLSPGGCIWVDEYMRTSVADIFAVGDCAEKRDFYTRRRVPVMLASTATSEARIAGSNLFKIRIIRQNKGTIAIFSTKVGSMSFSAAGLSEKKAREEGFEITTGIGQSVDRHPAAMPGAQPVTVKLIFSKKTQALLGGQMSGGASIGELINIVGLAIEQGIPGCELFFLQAGTHPRLTAAPTTYPLITAAQNAMSAAMKE